MCSKLKLKKSSNFGSINCDLIRHQIQLDLKSEEKNANFLKKIIETDNDIGRNLFTDEKLIELRENLFELKKTHGLILDKMSAVTVEKKNVPIYLFDELAVSLTRFKNVSFGVLSLMERKKRRMESIKAILISQNEPEEEEIEQIQEINIVGQSSAVRQSFQIRRSLSQIPEEIDEEEDCRNYLVDKEFNTEVSIARSSFMPSRRGEEPENNIAQSFIIDNQSGLIKSDVKAIHYQVAKLLSTNNAYLRYPVVENNKKRESLPTMRDPSKKVNVWTILKENIGKDLSRMSMPVYAKEPITLLEKVSEFLEYRHLLKLANNTENSSLRIANILGFFLAWISQSRVRLAASFNSLLGETYEFIDNDDKFIFELANNHPPVVGVYGESNDYKVECSFSIKTNLSLSGLEFETIGDFFITLKKTNERFTVRRPKITVHNFVFGNLYIWLKNDLIVTNEKTKEVASIHFKSKGWSSKHDYEFNGHVFGSDGKPVHTIFGKWDSYLSITDIQTKEYNEIIRMFKDPPKFEFQYYFNAYTINSNHKTVDDIKKYPPTESRLRPDVHAYEYGDFELASFEKNRLEENQRKRRKLNVNQTPYWFTFQMKKNEIVCKYKGGYFETKERGIWSKKICDLYND